MYIYSRTVQTRGGKMSLLMSWAPVTCRAVRSWQWLVGGGYRMVGRGALEEGGSEAECEIIEVVLPICTD